MKSYRIRSKRIMSRTSDGALFPVSVLPGNQDEILRLLERTAFDLHFEKVGEDGADKQKRFGYRLSLE